MWLKFFTEVARNETHTEQDPKHIQPKRRWPVAIAYVVVGVLYSLLSDYLTFGPGWILIPVMVVLVGMIVIAYRSGRHRLNRILALSTTSLITLTLAFNAALLVGTLPEHRKDAASLLRDGSLIWVSNIIIFAIWYWEVDGGGPAWRHLKYRERSDLLFPQMAMSDPRFTHWAPEFADYLFLAFNTSTAFSPTDTAVLSIRCKLLMMCQSTISLVVIGVLIARAVNIL